MPKTAPSPRDDPFADLSWDDLEQWVGSRSVERGRSYQKRGRVLSLARTPEGVLSGRVVGTGLYVTHVSPSDEDAAGLLSSECSCPLGGDCKHSVAIVLEYLARLKAGQEVASELPGEAATSPPGAPAPLPAEVATSPPGALGIAAKAGPVDVTAYMEGLTAPELIELVHELVAASDEAWRVLEARAQLASGRVGVVAAAARHELRRVASEIGWQNSWNDEGHTPDYGMVTSYLQELLAAGQPDQVLDLGREIVKLGTRQVEQCHDEGETACEIAEALAPVWQALARSSLSPSDRILWVYDRYAEDEYDLCGGAMEADIWDVGEAVWGEVADALIQQLASQDVAGLQAKDGWGLKYRRSNLAHRAIDALQSAGRTEEAVALAISEAPITDSYEQAVDLLLEAGRADEAKALALEGIRRTEATYPGISAKLRGRLRDLAVRENDSTVAAAFAAEEFALRPSLAGYCSLREAAQRAEVWPQVRECVLHSLETGSSPALHPDWPLADTGTSPKADDRDTRPWHGLLAEIALEEGDHARAVEWFRTLTSQGPRWGSEGLAERLARQVAPTHPNESIAIWRDLAKRAIAGGNRRAYEESLPYLRLMRSLLAKLGREQEWSAYLAGLRTTHQRRRALLETLNRVDGGPIIAK